MNIATDTSAVVAIILNEADKPAILQQTQGAALYAPLSLPWGIGNALSSLLRRSLISLPQAIAAINQYEHIPMTLVEVDFSQALTLAQTYKIYAYDAYMMLT